MDITRTLNDFDGKSLGPLIDFASSTAPTPELAAQLCDIAVTAAEARYQTAATWILKRWLESGFCLNTVQSECLIRALPDFDGWEATLHVLQMLPHFEIAPETAVLVYHFLKHNLTDPNKFVRAWTYNGLDVLAQQNHDYRLETDALLQMALNDEAPSVRARIGQILRQRT